MFPQTLTGQKYGEPLLPATIIESEFDSIIKVNYVEFSFIILHCIAYLAVTKMPSKHSLMPTYT